MENTDKAGEEYWSNFWKNYKIPDSINPYSYNVNYFPHKLYHHFFKKYISKEDKGKKILELGCGNSAWLPYFAKEFGLEIYGLDYSEFGCKQSEYILKQENLSGKIIQADFFDPPEDFYEKFDFVLSVGVVEHFTDTDSIVKHFSRFLKPGGVLLTLIPNMTGLIGWWQKVVNKEVYDVHVLIDSKRLEKSLREAGLTDVNVEYIVSVGFGVTVHGGKEPKFYKLKKIITLTLSRLSKIIWLLEMLIKPLPAIRIFSPTIISAARKKQDG
jgi:SAM-dependent methyltransferase